MSQRSLTGSETEARPAQAPRANRHLWKRSAWIEFGSYGKEKKTKA